jgi:hypothetical protein
MHTALYIIQLQLFLYILFEIKRKFKGTERVNKKKLLGADDLMAAFLNEPHYVPAKKCFPFNQVQKLTQLHINSRLCLFYWHSVARKFP